MKKALLILAIILVLAGIGYAGYSLMGRDETPDTAAETTPGGTQQPIELDDTDSAETNIELTEADREHLGNANRGQTVDATDSTEVTLTMSDFRFDTTYLRVKKGTTVTWINDGHAGHDVTPTTNSPQKFNGSVLMANGESYTLTFDTAGKYYYFCTPHSTEMRAIIEVIE